MFYYNVIPFIKLPLAKDPVFTYQSDQEIAFGSIILVPFGTKKIKGMLFKKTKKPHFPAKQIIKIIQEKQFTPKQLELARFMSAYYYSPLGIVLKFFFQQNTKTETAPSNEKISREAAEIKPTLTNFQKSAVKKILKNRNRTFLLFGPASSGKTEVAMRASEEIMRTFKKQVLVLVPEVFLAYQELDRYSKRFASNNVAIFHSNLKRSQQTFVYNGLKNGKIGIVIATRAGLFLPFKSLGLIVIDEEQDISYKQWDQSPFYHARDVATQLAHQHKSKLVYISSTPSVETFHRALRGEIELLKIPRLKTKKLHVKKPKIELVDLVKTYKKGQKIVLSPELQKKIAQNLDSNEISAILVPRRGKSSFSVCQSCKKILLCPNCQTPLNHANDNFRCLHCNYQKSTITKCSFCGSFKIVSSGIGTQSVAQQLQIQYPQAKIAIADGDSFKINSKREKTFEELKKNQIDILIGTYGIAKGFDFPSLSLTAVLNADDWSGQLDFSFDEQYLSSLFQLAGRINRPRSKQKGSCIIQTYRPADKLFNSLLEWNWEKFLQEELSTRKTLNYPPFSKLIKLTIVEDSEKKVEENAKRIYNSILDIAGDEKINEPYFGHDKKRRGKWKMHILLKTKKKVPAKLDQMLFKVGSQCKIDVDTESVF